MYNFMNQQTSLTLDQYIQDLFINKVFSIKDTELTYRTVNNWSEKGLISHFRKSDKEWHRFSFAQLIEISIYDEFRLAGFSLDKLIKIKKSINKKMRLSGRPVYISEIKYPVTPLTMALVDVLSGQGNVFLVSDTGCKNINFFSELIFVEIITGNSPLINEVYGDGVGVFSISVKALLDKLKINLEKSNNKLALLISAILDDESSYGSEVLVNLSGQLNSNPIISKVKKREYKDVKEIKDLKKLINEPNQSTTVYSDSSGAHKIVIEKEIK